MSVLLSVIDPGYSVSLAGAGGAEPRWGFRRVPLHVEIPRLPVGGAAEAVRGTDLLAGLDDECERWDGLS